MQGWVGRIAGKCFLGAVEVGWNQEDGQSEKENAHWGWRGDTGKQQGAFIIVEHLKHGLPD